MIPKPHFLGPIDVVVRVDLVDAILVAFADVLKRPFVKGIGVTGSILLADREPGDIDVVLVIASGKDWVENRLSLDLPTEVAGKSVDVFPKSQFGSWHLVLDLHTLTLYRGSVFNLRSVDPLIIAVVDSGDAHAYLTLM